MGQRKGTLYLLANGKIPYIFLVNKKQIHNTIGKLYTKALILICIDSYKILKLIL